MNKSNTVFTKFIIPFSSKKLDRGSEVSFIWRSTCELMLLPDQSFPTISIKSLGMLVSSVIS